ncbi:hypothetical protein [Kitasatospora sp. NBC_01539]
MHRPPTAAPDSLEGLALGDAFGDRWLAARERLPLPGSAAFG